MDSTSARNLIEIACRSITFQWNLAGVTDYEMKMVWFESPNGEHIVEIHAGRQHKTVILKAVSKDVNGCLFHALDMIMGAGITKIYQDTVNLHRSGMLPPTGLPHYKNPLTPKEAIEWTSKKPND